MVLNRVGIPYNVPCTSIPKPPYSFIFGPVSVEKKKFSKNASVPSCKTPLANCSSTTKMPRKTPALFACTFRKIPSSRHHNSCSDTEAMGPAWQNHCFTPSQNPTLRSKRKPVKRELCCNCMQWSLVCPMQF